MNIKIHLILEILPDSFEICKRIHKDQKGAHMGVEVLHAFILRRRRKTTPNKES